jgi:hypothetical protein
MGLSSHERDLDCTAHLVGETNGTWEHSAGVQSYS